jgi:hypothetical protein
MPLLSCREELSCGLYTYVWEEWKLVILRLRGGTVSLSKDGKRSYGFKCYVYMKTIILNFGDAYGDEVSLESRVSGWHSIMLGRIVNEAVVAHFKTLFVHLCAYTEQKQETPENGSRDWKYFRMKADNFPSPLPRDHLKRSGASWLSENSILSASQLRVEHWARVYFIKPFGYKGSSRSGYSV